MKKRIYHIITLMLLTVYTVFSTGIFVSIHHCCGHCYPVAEVKYCECLTDGHTHTTHCETYQKAHHPCHNTNLFFKILDTYDKKEGKTVPVFALSMICIFDYSDDKNLATISNSVLKNNELRSSHAVIQGHSFLRFSHQFIYYA